MIIGMIIILLRFDGGSTEEEHDIAHIASSITLPAPRVAGFFCAIVSRASLCSFRQSSCEIGIGHLLRAG